MTDSAGAGVSFVIPVYNERESLQELFDGIAAHTRVDTTPGPAFGRTYVWHDVVETAPGPDNSLVVTSVHAEGLLDLLIENLARLP